MIPDRRPGSVWTLYPLGRFPQGYVRTWEDEQIYIAWFPAEGVTPKGLLLSRREARMLAKRINRCLDATVKR